MKLNHRCPPTPEQGSQRPNSAPLAAPASRIIVALVLLGAIWLPSAVLSEGTDLTMIAVNVTLTAASLLALAGRRRQRSSRRFRQRGLQ